MGKHQQAFEEFMKRLKKTVKQSRREHGDRSDPSPFILGFWVSQLSLHIAKTCSGPKNMPPALPLPLHVPRRSKPKLNMRFEFWIKMETPPRRRRFFVSTPRKRKDRILHYCRLCSCRYVSRLHRVHVFSLHHVRNVRM